MKSSTTINEYGDIDSIMFYAGDVNEILEKALAEKETEKWK